MKFHRAELKNHLQTCPASVIFCNKEWNRWPNHCPEKLVRVPFTETKYKAKYGQLDVALALRDQKVLEQGFKAPRSVRWSLDLRKKGRKGIKADFFLQASTPQQLDSTIPRCSPFFESPKYWRRVKQLSDFLLWRRTRFSLEPNKRTSRYLQCI